MPLSKDDAPGAKPAKEQAAPEAEPAPEVAGPHPGDLTPGMYAEQEIGYSDAEPGSEELAAHGEKFSQAKMKHRLGH